MRRILLFAAILSLISFIKIKAETVYNEMGEITAGSNPVKSFYDEESAILHIFCAGIDVNDDGIYDEGEDEAPSWYTFDMTEITIPDSYEGTKVFQFEFNTGLNPQNIAMTPDFQQLFIADSEKVGVYNASTFTKTGEILTQELAGKNAAAVTAGNFLYVTVTEGENNEGEIWRYDYFDNSIRDKAYAGINPGKVSVVEDVITELDYVTFFSDGNDEQGGKLYYVDELITFFSAPDSVELNFNPNVIFQMDSDIWLADKENHIIGRFDLANLELATYNTATHGEFGPTGFLGSEAGIFYSSSGGLWELDKATGNTIYAYGYDGFYEGVNDVSFAGEIMILLQSETADESNNTAIIMMPGDVDFNELWQSVEVGNQPVYTWWDKDAKVLHVFCLGNDDNFDGIQDIDEQSPSWWTVKNQGGNHISEKIMEFEFGSLKFPFRPAVDEENKIIYIPHPDKISSYDLSDYSVFNESVAVVDATSLSLAAGHLLITRITDPESGDGELLVLNLQSGQVLQSVYAGINPIQSIYYPSEGGIGLAIISVGPWGSDESKLYYGNIVHMGDFSLDSLNVGNTVNHVSFNENKLYVTVNGSHKIVVLDLATNESTFYNTGTTGFDGPREAVYMDGMIGVTTYVGDLRGIDPHSGNVHAIFPNDYKLESILSIENDNTGILTAPNNDDYSPNNLVLISEDGLPLTSSVFEQNDISGVIYPNPGNGNFTLETEGFAPGQLELSIYDLQGNRVFSQNVNSAGPALINASGLRAGIYALVIHNGNKSISTKLNIVK
jgi:hypothetical protein